MSFPHRRPLRRCATLILLSTSAPAWTEAAADTTVRATVSATDGAPAPALPTATDLPGDRQGDAHAEPSVTLVLHPGGERLSSTLAEFARDQGWELAWEIDRDFPVDYAARFEGPFLDIIAAVVTSLRKTDAPIRARIYRANQVVRIVHATR